MAVEEYTIYQGDTGPIIRPRPTVLDDGATLDSNWSCFTAVNDADGAVVIAKREVTGKTADNLRFIAALTPTETNLLDVDDSESYRPYTQVIEVINTTLAPPFNIEEHYTLKVVPQGIDPI